MDKLVHLNLKCEDYGVAIIALKDNSKAVIESTWTCVPPCTPSDTLTISGTEGALSVREGLPITICSKNKPFDGQKQIAVPSVEWTRAIHEILENFIECVRRDEDPSITAEDGIAVLTTILCAYRSSMTGRRVPV
jgi:predicted dehydrogenase